MFQLQHFEKFITFVKDNFNINYPSVKEHKLQKLVELNQDLFDLTISLSFELPVLKFIPVKNYNTFNFEKDFGKILFAILNKNDRFLFSVLKKQHYIIQQWWYLVFSKYFLKKFREDILLENMENYYKLSDLLPYIEFPDVLESSNLYTLQTIQRKPIETLLYPLYLIQIPSNSRYKTLNYFIKKSDGSAISNITSGKIRNEIAANISVVEYGLIGVTLKEKNYKRKYNFEIIYYNYDYKNVLDIYRCKENNELDFKEFDNLKINSDIVFKTNKMIKINNEEELLALLKKIKTNKRYVVLSSNGVEILKTNIEYEYAKIVDYIYNDDYEAIGLKVTYNNQIYDIYFNVMNTSYVEGIENRFVKIGVLKYKNLILKVMYNAEVKKWHNKYDYCQICKSVKYKHKINGICNSCYNKLEKYVENLSESKSEECNTEFKPIYFENFKVWGDGKMIYFEPLKYSQLPLPLFEVDKFC
jgi:hypothetical protein